MALLWDGNGLFNIYQENGLFGLKKGRSSTNAILLMFEFKRMSSLSIWFRC